MSIVEVTTVESFLLSWILILHYPGKFFRILYSISIGIRITVTWAKQTSFVIYPFGYHESKEGSAFFFVTNAHMRLSQNSSVLFIIFPFKLTTSLENVWYCYGTGVFDHCEVSVVHHILGVSRRLTQQYLLYCPVFALRFRA